MDGAGKDNKDKGSRGERVSSDRTGSGPIIGSKDSKERARLETLADLEVGASPMKKSTDKDAEDKSPMEQVKSQMAANP